MERINEAQPNQMMQQRQAAAAYNQAMQQRHPSAYNQAMEKQAMQQQAMQQQVMQQPQPPVAYNQTLQQQYLPPTPEEPLVEQKEAAKPETEMSWEEKTRLAWAVLRGDTSSLNLATPKAEAPKPEEEANSFPGEGILRRQSSSESSKKVTFGQDEIRLTPSREQLSQAEFFDEFEDDQDENQSVSRPDKVVKKKKVFRGTKIIGDFSQNVLRQGQTVELEIFGLHCYRNDVPG
jgi:carboxylesterase type B